MVEQKEENEREVVDDPVAQRILDRISDRLQNITNKDRVLVDGNGRIRDIGVFTYKKNNEKKTDRIYSVLINNNGKIINLLYAPLDKGDKFAQIVDGQVILDEDIDLDKELLKRQVEKGDERDRDREKNINQNDNSDTNANEGRHIADNTE